MGFYGNITNTSRTQFQFDKIYPSRAEMDVGTYTDGIYAGRYVLVEYDSNVHQSSFYRVWIKDDQMYSSSNFEDKTKIYVGSEKEKENIYLPPKTIVYTENDNNVFIYYKVNEDALSGKLLTSEYYKQITSNDQPNYTQNYTIDTERYGAGRGYDSTVWQKAYIDNTEKYIMIAELNSVVPTFDVSADAPTVEPITPHFDTQSTDLYYKLHWQPTWGMRIAKAGTVDKDKTTDETEYPSDQNVKYTKVTYNKDKDEIKSDTVEYKGAIYYNKKGFGSVDHIYKEDLDDQISVKPTGKSGMKYNQHGGKIEPTSQPDIQEISIMLPSLGNALCDIWDKVYGYNSTKVENNRYRDIEWKDANPEKQEEDETLIYKKFTGEAVPPKNENYKGNEDLGGMTRNSETLAGCINMAHDLMGMIITTDTPNLNEDEYQKHLIYYKDKKYYRIYKYPKYKVIDNIDNATEVYLVDEELENDEWKVRKYNKKASVSDGKKLAIKDTTDSFGYKLVEIEDFAGNLSTINGLIVSIRNILESDNSETRNKETVQGTINVLNDIIDCFNDLIPGEFLICNNDGKVNSAGWTTSQAFEYYNTGTDSITKEDEKENQWISLSVNADVGKEKITLKHQLIEDNYTKGDTTTESDKNNASFDTAQISSKTLEDGQEFSFNGINNNNNINTLNLYTPIVDNAGHVVGKNTETVTLPFGYKYLETDGHVDEEKIDLYTPTKDHEGNIIGYEIDKKVVESTEKTAKAESTQDKIIINPKNKWIQTQIVNGDKSDTITIAHEVHNVDKDAVKGETNLNKLTPEEQEAGQDPNKIKIQDMSFDAAGHITANKAHTYVLPYGFRKITSSSTPDATTDATSNDDTISADNTQDTLTIAPSNKWIKTSVADKTLSLGHRVDTIVTNSKKETNLNEKISDANGQVTVQDTFTVNDITNDAAGHITANQSHTYKLPDGYKIIKTINTPTPDKIEIETLPSDVGQIASNTQDTITIEGANHWIKVGDNNKIIKIYHNSPDTINKIFTTDANVKNVPKDTSPDSPLFGQQFDIPKLSHDNAGHISDVGKYSIKLPQPSVTPNNAGNVMTGISVNSSTGVFTQDKVNIGTLGIAEFSVDTDDAGNSYTLKASDSINDAFKKLQNRIKTEETNRVSTIETAIKSLNVDGVSNIGAGQTISAWSETDGKISITTQSISITNENIDNNAAIDKSKIKDLDTALNSKADLGTDKDTPNKLTFYGLLKRIEALETKIEELKNLTV